MSWLHICYTFVMSFFRLKVQVVQQPWCATCACQFGIGIHVISSYRSNPDISWSITSQSGSTWPVEDVLALNGWQAISNPDSDSDNPLTHISIRYYTMFISLHSWKTDSDMSWVREPVSLLAIHGFASSTPNVTIWYHKPWRKTVLHIFTSKSSQYPI